MIDTSKIQEMAEAYASDQRLHLQDCITEYKSLVHRRSRNNIHNARQDISATYAVEGVLSRFSDDAVNSIYGLIWNAVDTPFTITNRLEPDADLTELATKLANVLEQKKTGFKSGLRHILKCYLEYGSGWMYVFADESHTSISHRVFSICNVARQLDKYNTPSYISLDRGDDNYTYIEKQLYQDTETQRPKIKYSVTHKDVLNTNVTQTNMHLKYNPIQELSLTGNYSDGYPVGYGINALPDIKRYDNIIRILTDAAAEALSPVAYMSAGVNSSNKAKGTPNSNLGTKDNPVIVDSAISDRIFPLGFIQTPMNSSDAWQIFQVVSLNIRESFSFINRLMTIKDDAQMTATEANIRSQADLSQIRDTIEVIFAFLNEIHRVQLYLLFETEEFAEWKDIDPANLDFFHTSIFKKEFEQQQVQSINTGLDIAMKVNQLAAAGQKTGLGDVLNPNEILRTVANVTNLALQSENQPNALVSLLQSLGGAQGGANVANQDMANAPQEQLEQGAPAQESF